MSEIPKALEEVLKIYAETDDPVSQGFYQGLCLQAIEQLAQLRAENKRLKEAFYECIKQLEHFIEHALKGD